MWRQYRWKCGIRMRIYSTVFGNTAAAEEEAEQLSAGTESSVASQPEAERKTKGKLQQFLIWLLNLHARCTKTPQTKE